MMEIEEMVNEINEIEKEFNLETDVCPLLTIAYNNRTYCFRSRCKWYTNSNCVIVLIAKSLEKF